MPLDGSIPPPRESGPGLCRVRKTALAERHPELLAERLSAASIFDAYCRRKSISTAELAEVWKCTEATVRDLRTGERDLRLAHIRVMPRRHARALFDLLGDSLDATAAA